MSASGRPARFIGLPCHRVTHQSRPVLNVLLNMNASEILAVTFGAAFCGVAKLIF